MIKYLAKLSDVRAIHIAIALSGSSGVKRDIDEEKFD